MKLYLAPILGITNYLYRNLFHSNFGGIDRYMAPFISSVSAEKINPNLFKDIISEKNTVADLIPQILSKNGADFHRMSNALFDIGYKEVNWNIGCPHATVTGKKKGAGILPYPDMIREFLDSAMNNQKCKLSVKMRLGMFNTDEYISVINVLNEYPLYEIIIHGRTGKQAYTGNVYKDVMKEAFQLSKHQFVYNGDIFTYSDYEKVVSQFPNVNRFMIGRGALSNPFLPSEIKGNFINNQKKSHIIKQFHDNLYHEYEQILFGGKHLMDKMKGIWIYLSSHLENGGELLNNIKRAKTPESYKAILNDFFLNSSGWLQDRGIYYFKDK